MTAQFQRGPEMTEEQTLRRRAYRDGVEDGHASAIDVFRMAWKRVPWWRFLRRWALVLARDVLMDAHQRRWGRDQAL